MTKLVVERSALAGEVVAPPSKSFTHRALVAGLLTRGKTIVENPLISDDTQATIEACRAFGASVRRNGGLEIEGPEELVAPRRVIDCRNSASTMRFLAPVAGLARGISILTGGRSLRNRPMGPLLGALGQLGVACYAAKPRGRPPLVVVGGGIRGGRASIRGDVSSQFISGLIFACPLAQRDVTLTLTTPPQSKPYIRMTLQTVRAHGIRVEVAEGMRAFNLPANQRYRPAAHRVPGDHFSAAFLAAAAAITGSTITIRNLRLGSGLGDEVFLESIKRMGASVEAGMDSVKVGGGRLEGIAVDVSDVPDLAPAYAAVACYAAGETVITGVRRLRIKESDRLEALSSELGRMGAAIRASGDRLVVKGRGLRGAEVDPRGDHRIAMACAVAALGAEGVTKIKDPECIHKSYPNFASDLQALGAAVRIE